jgi:ATP-dependent Clp protease ATP-binding subunit ClpA
VTAQGRGVDRREDGPHPREDAWRSEREQLKSLEKELKAVIFGQDPPWTAGRSSIKLARSGLRSGREAHRQLSLRGPHGRGQDRARQAAREGAGVEFLRFDMSEYSERHTVSRLIGAPPGLRGLRPGRPAHRQVNKHPYAVVLLDEIEKAHPELFNILLQVMDHATLTDNNGKKADFRNVVLIMTTNVGAREMSEKVVGFGAGGHRPAARQGRARALFTPEFRNRLDATVQFGQLERGGDPAVVDKEVRRCRSCSTRRR